MESFYVSKQHIDRCNSPQDYIITRPNIFNIENFSDLHAITIQSVIKLNALYVINYIIKSILKNDPPSDIVFKHPILFFKVAIKHSCTDEIALIKDISTRKSLILEKHIVYIEITEILSIDIKNKVVSLIKNCKNILFIISSENYIANEISNISTNIVLPPAKNNDPFQLYIECNSTNTIPDNLLKNFLKRNIDKLINCNTITTYYTTLRSFVLNITASGVSIHYICKEILDIYEPSLELVEYLAEMEHKCSSYSKSIFPLESIFNKIILCLKQRVKN